MTAGRDDRHRSCLAALFTMALTGCGDAPRAAGGSDIHIRDSAGIRIVEYAGIPAAPTLTLADEPFYTHGTRDSDYLFSSIGLWMGGVLFADGRAAVSDAENDEIVMLSRDGTRHEVIASAGQGPGEIGGFVALYGAGPGTLLVDDRLNRRLTLFADGVLVRSVPVPHAAVPLHPDGLDAAGNVLMSSDLSSGPESGRAWKTGHMVRFDLETRAADTVASFDKTRSAPRGVAGPTLFSYAGVVGVAGGEFVHGRNDIPELVWRRPDGSVRQIMRWQPKWVYPNAESRERFLACRRAALREDPYRTEAMIEADLASWLFDYDEPEPLFATIFGDGEGRAWIWHWQAHCYNRNRFTVIGPDGTWLGAFEPPDGFELLDVAGEHALVVVKDEMDVESVAVYELVGW